MIPILKEVDYELLDISSDVFKSNGFIPKKYTCDGENVSPPLNINKIPEEAKSIAIIFEDPDAPISTWVHWLIWNIPITHLLKENNVVGKQGVNDFSKHFYCGPCPMNGTHRYIFKVYALDTILNMPDNTKKHQLLRAMSNHIIGYGELVGIYKREK
jgi:Raf kinase inhibitor-like YbhB/YbcL family protein